MNGIANAAGYSPALPGYQNQSLGAEVLYVFSVCGVSTAVSAQDSQLECCLLMSLGLLG